MISETFRMFLIDCIETRMIKDEIIIDLNGFNPLNLIAS